MASTKLPTVLRIAEGLAGAFLAKPDFPTLEVANLSSVSLCSPNLNTQYNPGEKLAILRLKTGAFFLLEACT